jgi:hypothetical protein
MEPRLDGAMREAEPVMEVLLAVILVVPAARIVAKPAVAGSLLIVATDGALEPQITDLVIS